jgi:hypothetical protein
VQSTYSQPFSGPSFANGTVFTVRSEDLVPKDVWSKCGGNDVVSVKYEVRLAGDSNENSVIGEYSNNSAMPHHELRLVWRQC